MFHRHSKHSLSLLGGFLPNHLHKLSDIWIKVTVHQTKVIQCLKKKEPIALNFCHNVVQSDFTSNSTYLLWHFTTVHVCINVNMRFKTLFNCQLVVELLNYRKILSFYQTPFEIQNHTKLTCLVYINTFSTLINICW